jgi:hypothetical protein
MDNKYNGVIIPDEVVLKKIYLIRTHKVMLDKDLAELYNVETKYFKRAVRRNADRFPEDFMFELNIREFDILRRQFGTSSWGGSRCIELKKAAFLRQPLIRIWRRLTLPRFTAVPSARVGLTSLFGMGRGGPHRHSHHKVFNPESVSGTHPEGSGWKPSATGQPILLTGCEK